jgi:hypothetical protein
MFESYLESPARATAKDLPSDASDNSSEADQVGLHFEDFMPYSLLFLAPGVYILSTSTLYQRGADLTRNWHLPHCDLFSIMSIRHFYCIESLACT